MVERQSGLGPLVVLLHSRSDPRTDPVNQVNGTVLPAVYLQATTGADQ